MTVHDYLRIARERWKVILGCIALGVLSAALLTAMAPKEYSASVTVYVSARPTGDPVAAYQANLMSEQKVSSYLQLLSTQRIGRQVVDTLGLDAEPRDVANQLTATSQPDTGLIDVAATDRSPQRARDIVNVAARTFSRLITRFETPAGGKAPLVTARIIEPAALPSTPVSPRPMINIGLGMLTGLIAGYGAALLRNTLDTSVKTTEELNQVTGAPSLGVIANDPAVPKHPLIVHEHPNSPRAEAFRKLRTNLQYVDVDRPRKVIVVTSAVPEEGKTTTMCNVAIALAQAGVKVVVVETDLRRPRAADYLGLEGAVGVTTVLAGKVSLTEALQPWGPGLLDVLPSGPTPPNPSELLSSRQMRRVIGELHDRYEVVLLDAPPLLPVTDSAILGAECDGALLVVRHGQTTRHQLKTAIDSLDAVSVRLLGTVFTMTPQPKTGASSSYYHQYYYAPHHSSAEASDTGEVTRVMPAVGNGELARNGNGTCREMTGAERPAGVRRQENRSRT